MRVVLAVLALAVVVCVPVYAQDKNAAIEELKAKYEAKILELQKQFEAELAAVAAGQPVEKPAPAKPKWYDNIIINGYFQARYHAREYDAVPASVSPGFVANPNLKAEQDDFELRRLYINAIAPFNNKTQAVVTWAGVGPNFRSGNALSSETDWANIFVDYMPNKEWTFRIGQAPTWFGIDTCESSSCRFTPERWAASEGVPEVGLRGLWFGGPWDRGVYAINDQRYKSPDKTGFRTSLSITNGNFRSQDDDSHKDIAVDTTYFAKWGQIGAGWLDGQFAGDDRDAIGFNFRILPGAFCDDHLGFQGEWLDGRWDATGSGMAHDLDGFYLQGSWHFDDHPGTAYLRYEEFDPNKDQNGDEFDALHIGYIYDLTKMDKITVEYSMGELGNYDHNDFILQYQRLL